MRRTARASSSCATAGWWTTSARDEPSGAVRRLNGGVLPEVIVVPVQSWPLDTMNERSASYATRSDVATPRVLIADDQPDVLEALRLLLKGEGFRIESAGSPAAILEAVDSTELDAVLMDLNYARDTTSGQEGLDVLSQIRGHDPTLPVVVM